MPLQTILFPLVPETSFAGFTYPRYVARLDLSPFAKRIARRKPVVCGEYYRGLHVVEPRKDKYHSFYLGSDFAPGLRWEYADKISRSINHTGWYCDEFQDSKIRGVVFRLPHGRGFLRGWTMGEGMASGLDYGWVIDDEREAAQAADDWAKFTAEEEWAYQARLAREEEEREAAEREAAEREAAEREEEFGHG